MTADRFVRISPRDARYFELDNGTPFVPNGCNLASVRDHADPDDALAAMCRWIDRLAGSQGNFIRLWLAKPPFDIEPAAGAFDAAAMDRLRRVIDHAQHRGVWVKMCLEYFRYLLPQRQRDHLLASQPFARLIYHADHGGPLHDMQEYLDSTAGRTLYLRKLDAYARSFAEHPAVFGWELWNEMNCVHAKGWEAWTCDMLAELRKRFPRHLVMQSLGSLDSDGQEKDYEALSAVPGQDVAQAHRYLDEGAAHTVCHGPVDVSVGQAMGAMRRWYPGHPLLLAEAGAVEPRHSGPWRHYADDHAGTILHDVVFAGFFVGGAGAGQCWHWDRYIDAMDLWPHFRGFHYAVEGIDCPAERFEPFLLELDGVRVWGLRGQSVTLAWARDGRCDWHSEFERRESPRCVTDLQVDLPMPRENCGATVTRAFDPWTNTWHDAGGGWPDFRRSLVMRVSG